MNSLHLHIPTDDELDYRRHLISDEATMDYNAGYGDNGGCTYIQTPEQIREWYRRWNNTDAFYAYIVRNEDNTFIGEANLHKSSTKPWYEMGIVLEAKYRGMGYSVPALKLLLLQAFEAMNVQAVHNDFEETRIAAIKAHTAAGFKEIKRESGIIELLITREQYELISAIEKMTAEISDILSDCSPSIYLLGSVTLNDFKLGWSDIDILCLTRKQISQCQAEMLVNLRQNLLEREPHNRYYRSFWGGFLPRDAFLGNNPDTVIYWGTSGQRITDSYCFESFAMAELIDSGILLYGEDIRNELQYPSFELLKADVIRHYETIRKYTVNVSRSIKSFGWLLDIARCIYTLRTGEIIAKTTAGEWALESDICPVPEALHKAISIRRNPLKYKADEEMLAHTESLGSDIQCFADVLQWEIDKCKTEEEIDEMIKTGNIT